MNSRLSKISILIVVMLLFVSWGGQSSMAVGGEDTPPTMTITPSNGQTGVEVNVPMVIQFRESIKLANGDTLTSKNAQSIVTLQTADKLLNIEAEVKWSPTYKKITLQPKTPLQFGTKYRVGMKKAQVKNKAGVANEEVASVFTTESKEPSLTVTFEPRNQAAAVPIDTKINIVMNKSMRLANKKPITDASIPTFIKLNDSNQKKFPFTGHWDESSRTICLDPVGNLAPGTTYTITLVEKKLQDRQGTLNQESVSSTFTTEVPVDRIAPSITVLPAHGAKNIALTATATIQFAEDIVLSTGEALSSKAVSGIVLFHDHQQVSVNHYATWNKRSRSITLHLKEKLKPNSTYTIRVPAGVVKDLAGNTNGAVVATFTTKGK